MNTCKSFGFMVDKDVPWRITADIASEEMLNAASRYGFSSTDSILNRMYNYRIKQNYNSFKDNIDLMAQATIQDFIFTEECLDGSLRQKRLQANTDLSNVSDMDYLKLYLKMRLREEENKLTEYEQQVIQSNMLAEARTSVSTAIFKVEIFLNRPYDLSGSLTDKLKQLNGD